MLPCGLHTRGATFFELRVVSLYARRVAIICRARHQIDDYLLETCAARYDQAQREAHRAAECVSTNLIEVNYGKDHKRLADGPYHVYGSGGLMRRVEKYLHDGGSVLRNC